MKISSRFTIALHILCLLKNDPSYLCSSTSLAKSVNCNPVIIRRILLCLKKSGIVHIEKGKRGARLFKEPKFITLLDVYHSVDVIEKNKLFSFHKSPNPLCPVGASIQTVLELILIQTQERMEESLQNVTLQQVVSSINI
ncbi:transcriptional regulator [Bacillus cereus]|uniref:Rrf2 family transcriptional regulator n=1 Tax=Bacillus cereus TaxID=1396 RepID=UPI000BFA086C|nr:Rrf2 family transcriptional regulator [Bacillus cereus]PEY86300.1 transcriptional regulator [Bacillus cereus]PGV92929.1 transcriptional regulator [Bacillus cereus]PGY26742.1 transcriptional regulator [Bacillus cereus]